MVARGGRGGGTRSLWPLRANPAGPRSHHRTALSSTSLDIESVSLLHYGNSHNCVRVRLASHSRRQHPQRHRVRRDRPPDVDYGRGELVPRLKAILIGNELRKINTTLEKCLAVLNTIDERDYQRFLEDEYNTEPKEH